MSKLTWDQLTSMGKIDVNCPANWPESSHLTPFRSRLVTDAFKPSVRTFLASKQRNKPKMEIFTLEKLFWEFFSVIELFHRCFKDPIVSSEHDQHCQMAGRWHHNNFRYGKNASLPFSSLLCSDPNSWYNLTSFQKRILRRFQTFGLGFPSHIEDMIENFGEFKTEWTKFRSIKQRVLRVYVKFRNFFKRVNIRDFSIWNHNTNAVDFQDILNLR